MKTYPLPENSTVLMFVAPSAVAAASSVVFGSWAEATIAHRPAATRLIITRFFIPAPQSIEFNGNICPPVRGINFFAATLQWLGAQVPCNNFIRVLLKLKRRGFELVCFTH